MHLLMMSLLNQKPPPSPLPFPPPPPHPPPRSFSQIFEIVSINILVVTAGFDTTSSTLAFASYLLAINPEKQDQLCADIDAYYEDKDEVGE